MWMLAVPPAALAADIPTHVETLAMGNATAADPHDNAAVAANPALLGLHRRYDVQAAFAYGPTGGLGWGASATDARTGDALAIGFAYTGLSAEPPLNVEELPGWTLPGEDPAHRRREHDFALGFALQFFERKLAVGLGGDVLLYTYDQAGEGITGDLDAGLAAAPWTWLMLSAAGRDLIGFDEVGGHERSIAFGLRTEDESIGAIAGEFDLFPDTSAFAIAAGLEKRLGTAFIRAGWRMDASHQVSPHALSFGFGAESEAGALGYALLIPLAAGDDTLAGLINAVSLRIAAPEGPPDM